MLNIIRSTVKKYNMFSKGDTVVCGLSGGADSVCLLLALRELSEEFGITVEALHVNHCLRGEESDGDEEFCRMLCEKLGVEFSSFSCNVREFSAENSISCEEAARKLRYEIFRSNTKGKKMATAHNADDNLETMILNLVRGTGLKGLCGIPPVRDNIVRPLISVPRENIEIYLSLREQNYVTDSTNLTDDYTRNKIRHKIIPLMKELNSSLTETSSRTSDILKSENDFIEKEVSEAERKCRIKNGFSGLDEFGEIIRRRCIARLLSEKNISFSSKRLEDCDRIVMNGGKLNLSGDTYLISDGKNTEITEIKAKENSFVSAMLKTGENRIFSNCRLICEITDFDGRLKNQFIGRNSVCYCIDYDKIIGKAVVRNRKFGDKIQLQGRSFKSSIKKLINETIPVSMRDTLHFIEDEEGTVFAEKIGIADRVAPDEKTSRLLKITVEREETEA